MSEYNITNIDGVAFVLPRFESVGKVVRVGRFAIMGNLAFDRFGIGFQFLEAGIYFEVGPVWFGFCHISRQQAAFDRLEKALSDD